MILIVDDYADTRKVLIRLLTMEGYIALAVETGEQALSMLKTIRPKLVLLDYGLPGMDGLEVFAIMRATPALAAIPVVMFSAYSGASRERALRAGVDAYVVKGSMDWQAIRGHILRLVGPAVAATGDGSELLESEVVKR